MLARMPPKFIALLLALIALGDSLCAAPFDYFLPSGTDYDSSITTPEAYLGYEPGDWHIRHDQLIGYLKLLANESPRFRFKEIGRTYEQRPLALVTVTSPENQDRLGEIQQQHLQLSDPDRDVSPDDSWPVIINMGYGVHGNESSASNCVPLFAYHLAAAKGPVIGEWLKNAVILIDPCLNPDGLSRFAQWANSHRGQYPVPNAEHREHNEVWPGGRTNHYWFDLNRDWLLVQHPESQARVYHFHAWKPNVLTDYHEMSSTSTYFFQPGVPERKHPLTPEANVQFTERFAQAHAKELDQLGSLYYTQERFDDFYYGKGSTYPDIHGSVGILFEQASSRGIKRESPHGAFDFAFTIRNQLHTSFTSIASAIEQRLELLQYQQQFYRESLALGQADPILGYVIGHERDVSRLHALVTLLRRHQIRVHHLAENLTTESGDFAADSSYVIPLAQPQYRLIKACFERRTEFDDNIFYDVSSWALPLAFGVPDAKIRRPLDEWIGEPVDKLVTKTPAALPPAYAYAFEWHDYLAPRVLATLQRFGLRTYVTTTPIEATTTTGVQSLARGTILIPSGTQPRLSQPLTEILSQASQDTPISLHAITTGLTPSGADLGSPSIRSLKPVKPAIVVGQGVSAYESGEVWHLLDERMHLPSVLLELDRFANTDLTRYTHLIFVDGTYKELGDEKLVSKLKDWITGGGVLMAQKRAAKWAASHNLIDLHFGKTLASKTDNESPDQPTPSPLPYGDYHKIEDAKRTSGAIFRTSLDTTHPLGYGYTRTEVPVFRNSNLLMQPGSNPYETPLRYADMPLMSGYAHDHTASFSHSAAIVASKNGQGAVIAFVDNPNFRAFWYGTNKLFLNALFFGQIIEPTPPLSTVEDGDGHGHKHD